MKIIEVCPRYTPFIGGVETHVKELGERLVKKGFEVEIHTTDPSNKLPREEIINGIKVYRYRSFTVHGAYYFSLELYHALKKTDYDIVHSHNYHAFPLLISALAKKKNRAFFATFHFLGQGYTLFRSMLHIPYRLLGSFIVKKADRVICVTKNEKNILDRKFLGAVKKTVYIPNGVDFDRFSSSEPIFVEDGFKILYVGRLSPEKNLDVLFFAYKIIQEKISDSKLIIVGDGPDYNRLRELSKKLSLRNVMWMNRIPQEIIPRCYKAADVFVLPSKKEVQSISILEAMASGLPVVTSFNDGIKDIINHNQNGLFFRNDDHQDLADKLLFLNCNTDIRKKFTKNAQTFIRNNFDWKVLIAKYVDLFRSVANE